MFAGGGAGAAFAAAGAVFAFAALSLNASVAGVSIRLLLLFAAGSVAGLGTTVFASVAAGASAGVSIGASGLLDKTEIFPVKAGIARKRADSINVVAAAIVSFDKTVAVPRGLKAVLDTLLVNNAPASVFPGCSKTDAIRTRHERKNIPYKK